MLIEEMNDWNECRLADQHSQYYSTILCYVLNSLTIKLLAYEKSRRKLSQMMFWLSLSTLEIFGRRRNLETIQLQGEV